MRKVTTILKMTCKPFALVERLLADMGGRVLLLMPVFVINNNRCTGYQGAVLFVYLTKKRPAL
jgi:hypothetical protein